MNPCTALNLTHNQHHSFPNIVSERNEGRCKTTLGMIDSLFLTLSFYAESLVSCVCCGPAAMSLAASLLPTRNPSIPSIITPPPPTNTHRSDVMHQASKRHSDLPPHHCHVIQIRLRTSSFQDCHAIRAGVRLQPCTKSARSR